MVPFLLQVVSEKVIEQINNNIFVKLIDKGCVWDSIIFYPYKVLWH